MYFFFLIATQAHITIPQVFSNYIYVHIEFKNTKYSFILLMVLDY